MNRIIVRGLCTLNDPRGLTGFLYVLASELDVRVSMDVIKCAGAGRLANGRLDVVRENRLNKTVTMFHESRPPRTPSPRKCHSAFRKTGLLFAIGAFFNKFGN